MVYLSGTYALLWVRRAEALTPGLLKADDVHAAHGCNLDDVTDTAVHGIDLWRIYTGAFLSEQITASTAFARVARCLGPYLVRDGGVSGQNDAVLNESNADLSGRPQLFLRSFEPVTLQLEVALGGSVRST